MAKHTRWVQYDVPLFVFRVELDDERSSLPARPRWRPAWCSCRILRQAVRTPYLLIHSSGRACVVLRGGRQQDHRQADEAWLFPGA